MALADGRQTCINAIVAAMEAGSGGSKTAVATKLVDAFIDLVKSGDLNISNPSGLAAGPYQVSGSASTTGKMD